MVSRPRAIEPYGLAALAVAAAILGAGAGGPAPSVASCLFFVAAVVLAAGFGGRGPGLAATAAGSAALAWLSLGAGLVPAAAAAAGLLATGIPLTLVLAKRTVLAAALRAAEARTQMALAAAPLALWSVDARGTFTGAQGIALEDLPFVPDDCQGTGMTAVWRDRPELLRAMHRALAGETVGEEIATDRSLVRVTCAPLHHRDGTIAGAVGAAVDLTDRRSLEEQLRQAQKMEAIGRFTGGIAHDFNNVLTAILGYSDMTLAQITPRQAALEGSEGHPSGGDARGLADTPAPRLLAQAADQAGAGRRQRDGAQSREAAPPADRRGHRRRAPARRGHRRHHGRHRTDGADPDEPRRQRT